ncbi:ubiquitin carboxyl-terminal hydrolase 12A-like isoform X3 [Pleurodeles waltl]|uniref:ubiquitin carboxyl-terminal hydrolase 12A-like isoform X3 n=1 Tax=Pleurodeles waltl TaxID=8319 RepID=UPI0037095DBF
MATFHRDGTSVDNTASANDSEPKSASQASSNFTTYFGLQNEGNTCFLNSLLQCLYLTPEFKKLSRCESECGETLSEIKKIFNALQKKKSVSTSKLAACLGLKPFKQQDVPEVFHLLLNKLDHELSNGLLFKKLYESTMVSLTECTQCVKKDGLHIGCNIVILPLPVSSLRNGEQCCSVTDALEHFLRSSEMKGENQMYCSDCREKTDATLRQALTRLPRILVVQLKRFDFSFYEQRFVKLDNAMHINTTLEVPCEMELQKDKKSYDLFAICDHYGGFKSGHYSAIIKPEENDKWFRFDDSIVTSEEILDPEREKSLRGKSSGEKYDLSRSRTAYVLMYRQKLEREPQKSAPFPTDLWTPQPSAGASLRTNQPWRSLYPAQEEREQSSQNENLFSNRHCDIRTYSSVTTTQYKPSAKSFCKNGSELKGCMLPPDENPHTMKNNRTAPQHLIRKALQKSLQESVTSKTLRLYP